MQNEMLTIKFIGGKKIEIPLNQYFSLSTNFNLQEKIVL